MLVNEGKQLLYIWTGLNLNVKNAMARYLFLFGVMFLFQKIETRRSKYLVNVEYIQQCPEPKYANVESPVTDMKTYRINRTVKAFSFSLTLKRPWDEEVGFMMELDIWGYAGWTRLPYVPILRDFCGKMRLMFRDSSTDVMKSLGLHHCPIPPGVYTIRNYTCTAFGMNFPFTGKFRIRTIVLNTKTEEPIMCTISVIHVEQNLQLQ